MNELNVNDDGLERAGTEPRREEPIDRVLLNHSWTAPGPLSDSGSAVQTVRRPSYILYRLLPQCPTSGSLPFYVSPRGNVPLYL